MKWIPNQKQLHSNSLTMAKSPFIYYMVWLRVADSECQADGLIALKCKCSPSVESVESLNQINACYAMNELNINVTKWYHFERAAAVKKRRNRQHHGTKEKREKNWNEKEIMVDKLSDTWYYYDALWNGK